MVLHFFLAQRRKVDALEFDRARRDVTVAGKRRMTARPDVVLPQPDSPTRPTHSPGSMLSEKSSTAVTKDFRVANLT